VEAHSASSGACSDNSCFWPAQQFYDEVALVVEGKVALGRQLVVADQGVASFYRRLNAMV
jgi:hypothetical protein